MRTAITKKLAIDAFNKHLGVYRHFDHYTGIVTLHGLARLAAEAKDPALIETARAQVLPYVRGERSFDVNFPNYLCGGNGSTYLLWRGHLPEAEAPVRRYAEQILNDAPRDPNGILSHPRRPAPAPRHTNGCARTTAAGFSSVSIASFMRVITICLSRSPNALAMP